MDKIDKIEKIDKIDEMYRIRLDSIRLSPEPHLPCSYLPEIICLKRLVSLWMGILQS